jgi:superfamily I DNA and/or RNA helicase
MYVAEAIPMLFRAKSALIAGDIHQMPPSNQFSFADDGDGSEDEVLDDDYEPARMVASTEGEFRLLVAADEALGANSPHKVTLNVHYRSARKELIDFSNHAFYEGKLIIPSGNAVLPSFMRSAIVFEQVNGNFDKGLNEIEALRIVEWLDEIWSSQLAAINRPTVGVIVNNVRQRDRVNELIQNKCLTDRRFADCYSEEQDRKTGDGEDVSLFVRSVESVQGDERDIIIFGFTYSGSSRRFGPLVTPKFDGRKRLNVAITRAKRGMIVLNSLSIEHISNETEKESAERYFVYQYLRYAKAVSEHCEIVVNSILNQLNAERQRLALIEEETDSPFEDEVKAYIENLGFIVKPQVGESGFKIDLGVKLAQHDLNFLCGIECDGARYHSGWTARTRDVLEYHLV